MSARFMWLLFVVVMIIVQLFVKSTLAAPVDQKPAAAAVVHKPGESVNEIHEDIADIEKDKEVDHDLDTNDVEYGRYLKQVMDVLDADKEFQKRVENITHDQIIVSIFVVLQFGKLDDNTCSRCLERRSGTPDRGHLAGGAQQTRRAETHRAGATAQADDEGAPAGAGDGTRTKG